MRTMRMFDPCTRNVLVLRKARGVRHVPGAAVVSGGCQAAAALTLLYQLLLSLCYIRRARTHTPAGYAPRIGRYAPRIDPGRAILMRLPPAWRSPIGQPTGRFQEPVRRETKTG
jgi:hypothetical protein